MSTTPTPPPPPLQQSPQLSRKQSGPGGGSGCVSRNNEKARRLSYLPRARPKIQEEINLNHCSQNVWIFENLIILSECSLMMCDGLLWFTVKTAQPRHCEM